MRTSITVSTVIQTCTCTCMHACLCVCEFICFTRWDKMVWNETKGYAADGKRSSSCAAAAAEAEIWAGERASKKEIQQRAQSTTSTERDMLSEWASEQATTCPNWQGDTGARATNSAAKRNWERKSERRASERERGTQIERETNRRTRTRKCRLNQNACKNIVFSFLPALFIVFPYALSLIFFLFFMHFTLTRRLCAAEIS